MESGLNRRSPTNEVGDRASDFIEGLMLGCRLCRPRTQQLAALLRR
jgi:hypothetical protein